MKKPTASIGLSKQTEDYRKREGNYAKRGLARSNGQDLMRGEHKLGTSAKNLTWVKGNGKDLAGPARRDADKRSNLNNSPLKPPSPVSTGTENMAVGTSIFDPVLCELVYRWFCLPGGAVLDPCSGGSVRGIVASLLGYNYTGYDLRPEQIASNEEQAARICKDHLPKWICGDGLEAKGKFDLIFSCPPYGDLEVYSDDPRDLSMMPHEKFLSTYRAIIKKACACLKADRFACFVVGDFRDGKGFYRNFVSKTIKAFEDCGCTLYNEAVLLTAVGSLPIRVGRQFEAGRKLGKTHQNVLTFFNGNPKTIRTWPVPDFGEADGDLAQILP